MGAAPIYGTDKSIYENPCHKLMPKTNLLLPSRKSNPSHKRSLMQRAPIQSTSLIHRCPFGLIWLKNRGRFLLSGCNGPSAFRSPRPSSADMAEQLLGGIHRVLSLRFGEANLAGRCWRCLFWGVFVFWWLVLLGSALVRCCCFFFCVCVCVCFLGGP